MADEKKPFNPYDVDQMLEGGGLTRDIVVTSAKYIVEPMTRRDGSKVVDDKGQQSYFIGLRLIGLSTDPRAEGKESKYDFSAGKKAKPSPDGEMLLDEKGEPARVYKTSNLGKFLEKLAEGGFEIATLYPKVSMLMGAKLTMAGTDQKKADGTVKTYTGTDGKVHNSIEWFPEKYNGGAGSRAEVSGAAADAVTEKAVAAVVAVLAAGPTERKDVIRALGTNLKGDPDAIKITTMVARADFHTDKPWTFDGTTLKLKE